MLMQALRLIVLKHIRTNIDGLVQERRNSIANELLYWPIVMYTCHILREVIQKVNEPFIVV